MPEADVSTAGSSADATAPEHEGAPRTSADGTGTDDEARDRADDTAARAASGTDGAVAAGRDGAPGTGAVRPADAGSGSAGADGHSSAGTGADAEGADSHRAAGADPDGTDTHRAADDRTRVAGTGPEPAAGEAGYAAPGDEDGDGTDERQGLTPRQARHVRIALSAAIMIAVGAVLVLRLGSTHSVLTLAFYGMALILSGSALVLSRAGRTRWATLVLGIGVAVAVIAEWAVASMR